jgi:hypothetical protein
VSDHKNVKKSEELNDNMIEGLLREIELEIERVFIILV